MPMPTELSWQRGKPELTIRCQWISFIVNFTESAWSSTPSSHSPPRCSTTENRRHAVQLIENVANDLEL